MAANTIPAAGLTLIHDRPTSKQGGKLESRQLIQLGLIENVAKGILHSLRNNEQVRLRLGKKPSIHYGKRNTSLNHGSTTLPSEVFTGPMDGSSPLYFSGKLTHALEVQQAKEDTIKTDEALAALKSTLKSTQEQRASNEANLVKSRDIGKKELKPINVGGRDRFLGSTPSSPFLTGRSPGLPPTSVPLLSAAPTKEKIRLDAMRIPIVHLLAIEPMNTDAIARVLNASKEECEKVLDKVSRESNGRRELKDKFYRELDVWKFPYKSQQDRQTVIDHAVQIYDRTRLEKNDPLWQLLLPREERGKGKVLSRLHFHFDRQIVAPKSTSTTEKDGKESKDPKEGVSDREEKPRKSKVTKDPVSRKKASDDGDQKMSKSTVKLLAKLAKKESKYKSSERIEDSDEEAEAAAKVTVKNTLPVSKVHEKETEKSQSRALPNKSQLHKPRLSHSSTSSIENDKTRRPLEKERPKAPLSSTTRNDVPSSRISPRPRADSSPQKPSPLGSSPPTNSTDVEESSKGSTQSSAPSSPPSSGNDIPLAQRRRNYSPVTTSRTRDPNKRKSERSEDEPAAKKHHSNDDRINSLPKSLTSQLQHPTPERRSSGSSASSPDKSKVSKQDVIASAKVFTSFYGKYRELHEKLSRLTLAQREDKDVETLWKMHKRLEEMKASIWHDWARAGGGD